jgi:hypothetical protein
MGTMLFVFGFMLFLVTIMAVGVLMGRQPISGSCGGMAALGMETECDVCGGDKTKCDSEDEYEDGSDSAKADLGYDATKK